jgi:hypothetical protein
MPKEVLLRVQKAAASCAGLDPRIHEAARRLRALRKNAPGGMSSWIAGPSPAEGVI